MVAHLTVEQRSLARRLSAKGLSLREIGRQVGCSHEVVRAIVRRDSKRPVRSDPWQPGRGRLSLADREEISLGVRAGDSFTAIAARLGRAVSTYRGRWPATAAAATTGHGEPINAPATGLGVPRRRS